MNDFALPQGQTRYMQVASVLVNEIRSGQLDVGEFLPSEHELSSRFAVSRHTVREALRRLQQLGIVSARVGRGTKVVARAPKETYQYSASSIDEIISLGRVTRHVLSAGALVRADKALASELGCGVGQQFLMFQSVRWFLGAAEHEVAYASQVYVAAPYVGVQKHLKKSNSIIEAVVQHFGLEIAEIEHRLDAAPVPAKLAKTLRVRAGSAALKTVRRYSDRAGGLVLVSVSLAPAGRAAVTMRLRRGS
jgi:DNA-binding GntR family transcriptional regulator